MTTPLTLLYYYFTQLLPEAERAYQELVHMRGLLAQELQAAALNPSKYHELSTVLLKRVNHKTPSFLLSELNDARQQQGKWMVNGRTSLLDRSELLGSLLFEVSELGEEWLRVLNKYHVPNLLLFNPLYNRQPGA
jgi:hypothetical protein